MSKRRPFKLPPLEKHTTQEHKPNIAWKQVELPSLKKDCTTREMISGLDYKPARNKSASLPQKDVAPSKVSSLSPSRSSQQK